VGSRAGDGGAGGGGKGRDGSAAFTASPYEGYFVDDWEGSGGESEV